MKMAIIRVIIFCHIGINHLIQYWQDCNIGENMDKNYDLITKEGNISNYFLELDSAMSLIIDDIRDFIVKAIKFNDDFDKYIKDNRVLDLEKIFGRIKENH